MEFRSHCSSDNIVGGFIIIMNELLMNDDIPINRKSSALYKLNNYLVVDKSFPLIAYENNTLLEFDCILLDGKPIETVVDLFYNQSNHGIITVQYKEVGERRIDTYNTLLESLSKLVSVLQEKFNVYADLERVAAYSTIDQIVDSVLKDIFNNLFPLKLTYNNIMKNGNNDRFLIYGAELSNFLNQCFHLLSLSILNVVDVIDETDEVIDQKIWAFQIDRRVEFTVENDPNVSSVQINMSTQIQSVYYMELAE